MHEEPVAGGQGLQAVTGTGVLWPFGDVDVHADAEVGGQRGGGGERVVRARERGVDPDHPPTAGAKEALVLGQPARRAIGRRGDR